MSDDVVINIRERGGRQAAKEVGQVGRSLRQLGSNSRRAGRDSVHLFDRAGILRLTGAAAAVSGVVVEVRKATEAYAESRRVGTQTNAVIASTGGVANASATHVQRLADSLARKSGVDDEAIQSGENMLLTFRGIRNEAGVGNDVFDQTTRAALDMSSAFTAMGKNMTVADAALQIGKALQDPAKGISRLTRVGVTFTQQQKDQVEALTASGDRLGAQKVILRELNKEFGGSAARNAQPLDKMKVSVGNLQEAIGKGLSPAIDAAAGYVDRLATRAAPALEGLEHDLGAVFKRKDLTLEDKLDLSGKQISRRLGPFEREFERELGSMHVGDAISRAFEYAAPKMVDAAAKASTHAVGAFAKAWWHAGAWGKLFTVAMIGRKLGAFEIIGGVTANRFSTSFAERSLAQRGTWSLLGRRLGLLIGAAAAIPLAEDVLKVVMRKIGGPLAQLLDDGTNTTAVDRDRNVRRGRVLTNDPVTRRAIENWRGAHPNIDPFKLLQNPSHAARLGYPGLIPGAPGVPKHYAPTVSAPAARLMHIHFYVDGKQVAHEIVSGHDRVLAGGVNRVNRDKAARGHQDLP